MTEHRSDAELLAMVRAVAARAQDATNPIGRPDHLIRVSQKAFDDARTPARHPSCPTASNLCRRLGMRWTEVLDLAARERVFHTAGIRDRAQALYEGGVIDHRTRVAAVALIAARRGAGTLRPNEYEQERAQLLTGARGQHRRDMEDRLPTLGQFAVEDWDELLTEAGLRIRAPIGASKQSSPLTDVVEWFLIAQGYLPSTRIIHRFGREYGVAIPKVEPGALIQARNELRERRAAAGLWTPADIPSLKNPPPWVPPDQQPEPVLPAHAVKRQDDRQAWTHERIIAGLRLALRQLRPGERLNQPTLRRLAATNPAIPAPSSLGGYAKRNGTCFLELRDEAVRTNVWHVEIPVG